MSCGIRPNSICYCRSAHGPLGLGWFDGDATHVELRVLESAACTVRVQKVFDEEMQETLLYCHSTMREKKDQAIGDRFTGRFAAELEKLNNGLSKKRCLKKYDKVMVKIGRLKQKYSRVSMQ